MYSLGFNCPAMFPFWNFRTWNAPQGQFDPSMWSSMASTGPQHPGMGGFVSGCDPHFNASQQQQAQSQSQIEFLTKTSSQSATWHSHTFSIFNKLCLLIHNLLHQRLRQPSHSHLHHPRLISHLLHPQLHLRQPHHNLLPHPHHLQPLISSSSRCVMISKRA